MSHEPLIDEDEYESSQDSDFAPEDAAEHAQSGASDDSSDDDDTDAPTKPSGGKRKRQDGDGEAGDGGFENSGDEAIIQKGKKRRKKAAGTGKGDAPASGDGDGNDDGGEGGLIKTRSMRAAEKAERKVAAVRGPVTIDVDAVWAEMLTGRSATAPSKDADTTREIEDKETDPEGTNTSTNKPMASQADELPAMIRIKRKFNFAGKVHVEEKLVPRDSAEAKLYLESQGKDASSADVVTESEADGSSTTHKPPRKAFRSAFEPILEIVSQRGDLNLKVTMRLAARAEKAAKKLNTVEKSKMDWAGYVDKEGLKDELELAGRSKDSYTNREDFLARSEAKREEEARRARMASKV